MKYRIVADESCTEEEFTVYGAFVLPLNQEKEIRKQISSMRERIGLKSPRGIFDLEFHGTVLKPRHLEYYIELVDVFFDSYMIRPFLYKIMILNNYFVDHDKHNGGDSDLGYWKYYNLFLERKFGQNGYINENMELTPFVDSNEDSFHVILDEKRSKYNLEELKRYLNHPHLKLSGRSPWKSVEARKSKNDDLLQLNDVILHAISTQINGHKNQNNSKRGVAKEKLRQHINKRMGVIEFLNTKTQYGKRFESWRHKTKEEMASLSPG